ncbi:MAG: gliding motility-associated C-terminal domain-containing protein [Cyclobacteriaceae bacterium]|nr:gliding motility-associated C-terminal domain-containing protein [Cyclobacteriaceae bacterium]
MRVKALLYIFLLSFGIGHAQFVLDAAQFSLGDGNTDISVSSDINFNNSSISGNGNLILVGADQTISSSILRSLSNLTIANSGNKTFSGDFLITNSLSLQSGIIIPSGTFSMSANATLDATNSGSVDSHIQGTLHRAYNGAAMSYPIGINNRYNPVIVESATGTNPIIGITALSGTPAIATADLPLGIPDYSSNWSWEVTAPVTSTFTTAIFTLPFLDEDKTQFGLEGYRPLILYNETGQPTANLYNGDINATSFDSEVTALDAGGKGLYFIGKELITTPIINNVITPDGNSMNDYLTIVNLSLYPENKIKLIDRYGVEVYSAENYVSPFADSAPGEGEDFSKILPPGNYVCILEYTTANGETLGPIRQMISVLQK